MIRKYFVLIFWVSALVSLAIMQPTNTDFSFCLLHLLGIDGCMGCGLGHSISYLFHGDLATSFFSHPLGIPAVLIIAFRIYTLIKIKLNPKQNADALREFFPDQPGAVKTSV